MNIDTQLSARSRSDQNSGSDRGIRGWACSISQPTACQLNRLQARSRYINSTGDRSWVAIQDSESRHIWQDDLKRIMAGRLYRMPDSNENHKGQVNC